MDNKESIFQEAKDKHAQGFRACRIGDEKYFQHVGNAEVEYPKTENELCLWSALLDYQNE